MVQFDEEVLVEVAEDGAGCHAWVMGGVLMSRRMFIGRGGRVAFGWNLNMNLLVELYI